MCTVLCTCVKFVFQGLRLHETVLKTCRKGMRTFGGTGSICQQLRALQWSAGVRCANNLDYSGAGPCQRSGAFLCHQHTWISSVSVITAESISRVHVRLRISTSKPTPPVSKNISVARCPKRAYHSTSSRQSSKHSAYSVLDNCKQCRRARRPLFSSPSLLYPSTLTC